MQLKYNVASMYMQQTHIEFIEQVGSSNGSSSYKMYELTPNFVINNGDIKLSDKVYLHTDTLNNKSNNGARKQQRLYDLAKRSFVRQRNLL